MKLTSEVLLKDGWTLIASEIGIFDDITEEVFTLGNYEVKLGLFDCMGIISTAESEPYVQFFAWFLTVGEYRGLFRALKINREGIRNSRIENLK